MRSHMANALEIKREGHDSCGSSTSRCSTGTRDREGLCCRAPALYPCRPRPTSPRLRPTRWQPVPAPTTLSWTALRPAAAVCVSTTPRCRCPCSKLLGFTEERRVSVWLPHGGTQVWCAPMGVRSRPRPCVHAAAGSGSIRDVMAFPKTGSGSHAMSGRPSAVSGAQLKGRQPASDVGERLQVLATRRDMCASSFSPRRDCEGHTGVMDVAETSGICVQNRSRFPKGPLKRVPGNSAK